MDITQHIIKRDGVRLYATLYEPDGDTVAAVLICPPLLEERKAANRALVETADNLCTDGFRVLRFDYSGCGDSTGEFDSFTMQDWLADVASTYDFLKQGSLDTPAGIAGLRLGASLAALRVAAERDCDFTVLWEPILDGSAYIQQELRRSLTKEMATFGKNRRSRTDLIEDLENGKPIDLDGYSLSPTLYTNLCALDLARVDMGPKPALVLNITHRDTLAAPLVRLEETWKPNIAFDAVQLQPFWNLVGYIDPSPAIEKTRTWLTTTLGE